METQLPTDNQQCVQLRWEGKTTHTQPPGSCLGGDCEAQHTPARSGPDGIWDTVAVSSLRPSQVRALLKYLGRPGSHCTRSCLECSTAVLNGPGTQILNDKAFRDTGLWPFLTVATQKQEHLCV